MSERRGFFFPVNKKYFQESNNKCSQCLYLFLCFLAPDLGISQKRGIEEMGVEDKHKGKERGGGGEEINCYIYGKHVPTEVKSQITSFHT